MTYPEICEVCKKGEVVNVHYYKNDIKRSKYLLFLCKDCTMGGLELGCCINLFEYQVKIACQNQNK